MEAMLTSYWRVSIRPALNLLWMNHRQSSHRTSRLLCSNMMFFEFPHIRCIITLQSSGHTCVDVCYVVSDWQTPAISKHTGVQDTWRHGSWWPKAQRHLQEASQLSFKSHVSFVVVRLITFAHTLVSAPASFRLWRSDNLSQSTSHRSAMLTRKLQLPNRTSRILSTKPMWRQLFWHFVVQSQTRILRQPHPTLGQVHPLQIRPDLTRIHTRGCLEVSRMVPLNAFSNILRASQVPSHQWSSLSHQECHHPQQAHGSAVFNSAIHIICATSMPAFYP